jgi:hypothetical protein
MWLVRRPPHLRSALLSPTHSLTPTLVMTPKDRGGIRVSPPQRAMHISPIPLQPTRGPGRPREHTHTRCPPNPFPRGPRRPPWHPRAPRRPRVTRHPAGVGGPNAMHDRAAPGAAGERPQAHRPLHRHRHRHRHQHRHQHQHNHKDHPELELKLKLKLECRPCGGRCGGPDDAPRAHTVHGPRLPGGDVHRPWRRARRRADGMADAAPGGRGRVRDHVHGHGRSWDARRCAARVRLSRPGRGADWGVCVEVCRCRCRYGCGAGSTYPNFFTVWLVDTLRSSSHQKSLAFSCIGRRLFVVTVSSGNAPRRLHSINSLLRSRSPRLRLQYRQRVLVL